MFENAAGILKHIEEILDQLLNHGAIGVVDQRVHLLIPDLDRVSLFVYNILYASFLLSLS